jgi:hypothetical protein
LARIFPERLAEETPSEAERRMFEALRDGLGEPYVVFAQVAWLTPVSRGRPRDGETDFLIAHPDWGLLAVEVKGGVIAFDRAAGWTSNGQSIKDPFDQARRAQYALGRALKEAPTTSPYDYPLGRAVWFPDCEAPEFAVRPDAQPRILLDADDLSSVDESIEDLYAYWLEGTERAGPGSAGIEALINFLGQSWSFRARLGSAISREAQIVRTLTQQQFGLLRFLERQPRALIAGCAGSGKTVLAVEKARRLTRSGFRVLLTCYNKSLATHLKAELAATGIEVDNFHHLCYRLAHQSGLDLPSVEGADLPSSYFSEQLPEALSEAARRLGPQFDAIIVDEGQDFEEVWWLPLVELLRDPEHGVLYVFFDDHQDIYGGSRSWPIQGEPFRLHINCRNTRAIHRLLCSTLQDGASQLDCPGPPGREPERIQLEEPSRERDALRKALHRLVQEEGVPPRDIVVLTPRGQRRSSWRHRDRLGNLTLVWGMSPGPGQVQVSTIHSFKGLERPVVIMSELEHLYPAHARDLLYVGRSRASHHLIEIWPKGPLASEHQDKTPELVMEVLGVDKTTARFIIAQERGEIDGDIEVLRDPPKLSFTPTQSQSQSQPLP